MNVKKCFIMGLPEAGKTTFLAALWPGIFIGIASIGFMLIGDGLRDALDPRFHK